MYLRRLVVPVVMLAVFAACDEETVGSDVGPSSLDVRAYVDVDGDGAFDEGDTPVEGATIVLTAPDGSDETATTGSDGTATFEGLQIGSYQLSYTGQIPAGATLAGATHPVVSVSVVSDVLTAEFRFVNFPGTLEGRLFRDDNASGDFDAGDTPAPGIPVAAYAGSTAEGDPVAETSTGDAGVYRFEGLRPGPYTLEFTALPTMDLTGGATQTVTVGADTTTTHPVQFTGDLTSPIDDVRTVALSDGSEVVAVEGVVTWQPSFSDEVFVLDETGGILVYAADVNVRDMGLARGDTILVVGTTNLRFGEPQIASVTMLLERGSGPAPDAVPTTAVELNAGSVQHRLVTIRGATVTSVDTLSYDNQFVTLTDPAGDEFGVYADSRTGVQPAVWQMGGLYDVTGVPGYDSRYAYAHRIEVRGTADVVPAEPPITIAEAKAEPLNTTVSIEGVVSWQPGWNDEVYIQDATGGIQVYGGAVDASSLGLVPGSVVRVSGTTEDYFGELQISDVTYLAEIDSQAPPTPVLVTPAEIASGDFVHQLTAVEQATVISVDDSWNTFGNQLVTLETTGGEQFGVYVDSRSGVSTSDWTVGNVYDVTGVINYDSRRAPFDYRIWVRGPADVVAN